MLLLSPKAHCQASLEGDSGAPKTHLALNLSLSHGWMDQVDEYV